MSSALFKTLLHQNISNPRLLPAPSSPPPPPIKTAAALLHLCRRPAPLLCRPHHVGLHSTAAPPPQPYRRHLHHLQPRHLHLQPPQPRHRQFIQSAEGKLVYSFNNQIARSSLHHYPGFKSVVFSGSTEQYWTEYRC
ncbi:hypothetical protein Hdeb2414_s0015g00448741 [Helianthus debilis subsp. tardiflorus]